MGLLGLALVGCVGVSLCVYFVDLIDFGALGFGCLLGLLVCCFVCVLQVCC